MVADSFNKSSSSNDFHSQEKIKSPNYNQLKVQSENPNYLNLTVNSSTKVCRLKSFKLPLEHKLKLQYPASSSPQKTESRGSNKLTIWRGKSVVFACGPTAAQKRIIRPTPMNIHPRSAAADCVIKTSGSVSLDRSNAVLSENKLFVTISPGIHSENQIVIRQQTEN